MLAQVVLIQQLLLHGWKSRRKRHGVEIHKGHFLQHHGVVDALNGSVPQVKGPWL